MSTRNCNRIIVLMGGMMAAAFVCLFLLVGCNKAQHPDVKDAVDSAMTRNDLGVVKVSQDRDKGVLTLTGDVDSAAKKMQAEEVAKQTAPDYAVANELAVRPRLTTARPRPSTTISTMALKTTSRPRSRRTRTSTIRASMPTPRTARWC